MLNDPASLVEPSAEAPIQPAVQLVTERPLPLRLSQPRSRVGPAASLPDGVEVLDHWLPESLQDRMIETLNWMPMYFLNRATRFDTHALDIHWYYPVAVTEEALHGRVAEQLDGLAAPLDVIRDVWQALVARQASTDGAPLGLYECSVSANTFGTEGNPHFDFRNRNVVDAHYTALIYCVPRWEAAWAGETLFFDADTEINGGVLPKPGRMVVMRGDPYHVGRSVSRICPLDRRVLVFKYWHEARLHACLSEAARA